jgi:UTP-glucose-1-phosphate uridylyltransferase
MKLIDKKGNIRCNIEVQGTCIENIVAVEDYMFPLKRYEIVVYDVQENEQGRIDKLREKPTDEQILYALGLYGDIYSSKAYVNEYYELWKEVHG